VDEVVRHVRLHAASGRVPRVPLVDRVPLHQCLDHHARGWVHQRILEPAHHDSHLRRLGRLGAANTRLNGYLVPLGHLCIARPTHDASVGSVPRTRNSNGAVLVARPATLLPGPLPKLRLRSHRQRQRAVSGVRGGNTTRREGRRRHGHVTTARTESRRHISVPQGSCLWIHRLEAGATPGSEQLVARAAILVRRCRVLCRRG